MPEFCSKCGNLLLPKRNKKVLFCKVCNEEFPLDHNKEALNKYKGSKGSKKTKDQRAYRTAVITDTAKVTAIDETEREAYEDYFENEPGESEAPEQD
jgi:DNA-directed RNA polymerase subunit M/transcription elongation factor TFIIS